MQMKRLLTTALILVATLCPLLAQDLKVIGFRHLENDLTANRYGTQMIDQNGETAALIKIQTP